MEQESKPNAPAGASTTPAKTRPWSAWMRLGLLAVFIGTLPFAWGETASCDGPAHVYTGLEVAQKPGNIIPFIVIFGTPVLLGFLQYLARAAWVRLGIELIAGMFASLGTFHCFLSAIFSGNLGSRKSGTYPAPFIATLVVFVIMIDAFWGAAQQIHALLWARRRAGNVNTRPAEVPPSA